MPRNSRRQLSGYARLAQAEEEEEEERPYSDHEDDPFLDQHVLSSPGPEYAPIQPKRTESLRAPSGSLLPRRPRRRRTNSGVDIKAINARFERWADEIKDKFKRRKVQGKSFEEETLEIHHSVFQAPDGIRPADRQTLESTHDDSSQRLSSMEFDDIVESVRTAIELGMHPTLISQGSSGSYFARNSGGKVVGVFKPKDEEPYANKNPKWTKWIHRNLFPFAFGRACLIPNLSYVSEAAAYVLDVQLRTNLVPFTGVVSLSSKSFHYDYFDRTAYYRKRKPLPEKQGSFQVFLKGFKGATEFFQQHPWPDQHSTTAAATSHRKKRRRKGWTENCRPTSNQATEELDTGDEDYATVPRDIRSSREQYWTEQLQLSFRQQLEKLVILDYIMRNTDRGSDNWMIRIDKSKDEATVVLDLPSRASRRTQAEGRYDEAGSDGGQPKKRNESMTTNDTDEDEVTARVGAIDNSLSWPWKHPDAWRSYPFGWLFLPVGLIGRPFSEQTRQHFLPLLTSKDWWSDTQVKLRKTFEIDADFKERMFARQIAVMKGQAWNVVETLKTPDHGPLELTRRSRVCVWDDLVDIPVAVPLSRPSEEMRRAAAEERLSRRQKGLEEEEMDISAAREPTPVADNHGGILGSAPERGENPFNSSRGSSTQDLHTDLVSPPAAKELSASAPRPRTQRSTTAGRSSFDVARSMLPSPSTERRRRFSFAVGGRGFGSRLMSWGDGDEEDGDLGYSAANDPQNVTRKVIVERIEMVKSKTPFFEWC